MGRVQRVGALLCSHLCPRVKERFTRSLITLWESPRCFLLPWAAAGTPMSPHTCQQMPSFHIQMCPDPPHPLQWKRLVCCAPMLITGSAFFTSKNTALSGEQKMVYIRPVGFGVGGGCWESGYLSVCLSGMLVFWREIDWRKIRPKSTSRLLSACGSDSVTAVIRVWVRTTICPTGELWPLFH